LLLGNIVALATRTMMRAIWMKVQTMIFQTPNAAD